MFSAKLNKYKRNYAHLVGILKESGLDTEEKLDLYIKRIFKRVAILIISVLSLLVIANFLAPNYIVIWTVVAVLVLAWGLSSAGSAYKIIRHYILAELRDPPEATPIDFISDGSDKILQVEMDLEEKREAKRESKNNDEKTKR